MSKEVQANPAALKSSAVEVNESKPYISHRDSAAIEMHKDSYGSTKVGTDQNGQKDTTTDNGPTSTRSGSESQELKNIFDTIQRNGSLTPVDKQLRSLAELSRTPTPNDHGLDNQTVGKDRSQQDYIPENRTDRLSRFTRQNAFGQESITREYQGRKDHLLSEETSTGRNSLSYKRSFERGKGPNGLTSEAYSREDGVEAFKRSFEPSSNSSRLLEQKWTKKGSYETSIRRYQGREDGLAFTEIRRDRQSEKSIRSYEQGKGPNGLISQSDWSSTGTPPKSDQSGVFNPDLNKDRLTMEKTVTEPDRSTVARTFSNRIDKLTSETEVTQAGQKTTLRNFGDGKVEQTKVNPDKSQEFTRRNADGSSLTVHTSSDGKQRESSVKDTNGQTISINGEDARGKYVAKEIPSNSKSKIAQRNYIDGTVITRYPEGKSGPSGARAIVQEKGQLPRLFDGEGNEIKTDNLNKQIEVATRFNENGTIKRSYSDGTSSLSSLNDYVAKSTPNELNGQIIPLTRIAKAGEAETSQTAIKGLFKALEAPAEGQAKRFFSADVALNRLNTNPETAQTVHTEALKLLPSSNSRVRALASGLVGAQVESWGTADINAISKNPSPELANTISKLSPDQIKPHKSSIEEGLKETTKADPTESVDTTKGKTGAIGVLAATGGSEALKLAGYEVKEIGDLALIETNNGVKFTFDKQANRSLRLRSVESPGPLDGESETTNFDASTGEISSKTRRDQYGDFSEKQYKDTEHGVVSQRTYESTKMIRTLFDSDGKDGKINSIEVRQQEGKAPVLIDAQGGKMPAATHTAIALATSFEDAQNPKTIFSDGKVLTRPIKDFVGGSNNLELSRHTNKFESLAQSGPELAQKAGIDALVKLYSGKDGDHFKSANQSLRRLSKTGHGDMITGSILEAQIGRGKLTRESVATNKTISLIAGTTGYDGLAKAGLDIDKASNSATLNDGTRYNFVSAESGVLKANSIEDRSGQKFNFEYNDKGQLVGKVPSKESGKEPGEDNHIPDKSEKTDTRSPSTSYENVNLPPLQKGWGPYQALDQMRSQGKIQMSAKEMKAIAEYIRDRDFAKLGRNYYKVGETPKMPSHEKIERIKAALNQSNPSPSSEAKSRDRVDDRPEGSDRQRDGGAGPDQRREGRVVREFSDRKTFYRAQNDGQSCSAFSMAMMASDHIKGSPVTDKEATAFKKLAGTTSHGYRGSLDDMASQLETAGLNSKAYKYDKFGENGMKDLNAELDKGHTAVARVVNDRTGNRHYIYISGRDAEGNYIIGDPDRKNKNNNGPVSPERLMKLMSNRSPDGGFVAGWAKEASVAKDTPGTAAYRASDTSARQRLETNEKNERQEKTTRQSNTGLEVISSHRAKSSGYFPYNDSMEGGHFDRKGKPLRTLQDYLAGKADYVSVAMDTKVAPYGSRIRIPELEQKYGREIDFRLVDTGRAFRNKGTSKIDICVKTRQQTYDDSINGHLTVQFVKEGKADTTDKSPSQTNRSKEVQEDAERKAIKEESNGQVRLKGGLKPVVVLDAGHGGHDSGATVNGAKENVITQDITTRLAKHLNKMGIVVKRTNPDGDFRPLSERSQFANAKLGKDQGREPSAKQIADAFVSIHANHDGAHNRGGGSARGFQTYFYGAKADDGTSELANSIHSSVIRANNLDVKNGGVKSNRGFHVIKNPEPPAVLLETGFLTNDSDRTNLSNPAYREKLAASIAEGIAKYLKNREPRQ